MREIKFRAWDRVQNVMRGWDWLEEKQGTYLNSKYFHAMQYTGFKDKNGKPIFEGDVLEYPASPRLQYVTWDTERGRWLDVEDHERCSIIGNIHENPELLKK